MPYNFFLDGIGGGQSDPGKPPGYAPVSRVQLYRIRPSHIADGMVLSSFAVAVSSTSVYVRGVLTLASPFRPESAKVAGGGADVDVDVDVTE